MSFYGYNPNSFSKSYAAEAIRDIGSIASKAVTGVVDAKELQRKEAAAQKLVDENRLSNKALVDTMIAVVKDMKDEAFGNSATTRKEVLARLDLIDLKQKNGVVQTSITEIAKPMKKALVEQKKLDAEAKRLGEERAGAMASLTPPPQPVAQNGDVVETISGGSPTASQTQQQLPVTPLSPSPTEPDLTQDIAKPTPGVVENTTTIAATGNNQPLSTGGQEIVSQQTPVEPVRTAVVEEETISGGGQQDPVVATQKVSAAVGGSQPTTQQTLKTNIDKAVAALSPNEEKPMPYESGYKYQMRLFTDKGYLSEAEKQIAKLKEKHDGLLLAAERTKAINRESRSRESSTQVFRELSLLQGKTKTAKKDAVDAVKDNIRVDGLIETKKKEIVALESQIKSIDKKITTNPGFYGSGGLNDKTESLEKAKKLLEQENKGLTRLIADRDKGKVKIDVADKKVAVAEASENAAIYDESSGVKDAIRIGESRVKDSVAAEEEKNRLQQKTTTMLPGGSVLPTQADVSAYKHAQDNPGDPKSEAIIAKLVRDKKIGTQ